jgi:hypothetical protein
MSVTEHQPRPRAEWERATSPSDTILRRFIDNWTDSIEAHGIPAGGQALRQDGFAAVDLGRPSFGANVATLTAPLVTERVDEVMANLATFYRFADSSRTGTAFLFSPWPTPNLESWGWSLIGYEPLMLRPAGGDLPEPPPGLRIEAIRDEADLRAFELAMVRGFESAELEAQGPGTVFTPGILDDDRFHLWVGYENDEPVSAAATFVSAGMNNVILVGTVPAARRRGYGAALTWRATFADPTLPALLLATDDGQPVYARIDYLPLFQFTVWSQDRPATHGEQ